MKRSISRAVVGMAAFALGLTGCGGKEFPAYSSGVKYGLRQDPILKGGAAKDLGEDRYDPDRPGVFPIMKLDDVFKLDHPYHAKSRTFLAGALKKIIDKTHANPDQLTPEQRQKLEDQLLSHPAQHRREFAAAMDKILRDPTQVPDKERKELEGELEAKFGTPAKPTVNVAGLGKNDGEQETLNNAIAELKLDDATLAMGSTRFRIHCLHCHGVPGDGRGPTARWINPHPRDFRAGMFKFQSVDRTSNSSRPPARADLLRTLRGGIEGTAMPAFNLRKDDELEALVSYVIHLSLRGNVEMTTIMQAFTNDAEKLAEDKEARNLVWNPQEGTMQENVKAYTALFLKEWLSSNQASSAIKVNVLPFDPDDMTALAASVKRGQQIFNAEISNEFKEEFSARLFPKAYADAKEAALVKAIADAEAKAIEDAEAKAIKDAEDKGKKKLTDEEIAKIKEAVEKDQEKIKEGVKKEHARIKQDVEKIYPKIKEDVKTAVEGKVISTLTAAKCVSCHTDYGRQARFKFDEWGTLVRPNNLPMGALRGGKRPVDIYYRIHSGIPGSEMTPFGKTFEGNEQYLWDLVNFVSVLPYPLMRDSLKLRID